MLHLDEEKITALLDGELKGDEARNVRTHLATCGECTARFEDVRAYFDEANRLVRVLEVAPKSAPIPLVLYPEAAPARRRPLNLRPFAWAASLLMAIGLGYYVNQSRSPLVHAGIDSTLLMTNEAARQSAAEPAAAPVGTDGARADAAVAAAPAKDAATAATKAEIPAPTSASDARIGDKELAQAKSAPESALSAMGASAAARQPAAPVASPPAPAPASAGGEVAGVAGQVRREDSPALRAAKPAESRDALAANAFDEKRAAEDDAFRLQDKVTLQEAAHSLGGTVHLINGLSPVRLDRLAGRLVPGASSDLQLIRVVYLDSSARELWLDQQYRMAGTAVGDTVVLHNSDGGLSLQWFTAPDGWLSLTGHLSEDSLRSLARRVE